MDEGEALRGMTAVYGAKRAAALALGEDPRYARAAEEHQKKHRRMQRERRREEGGAGPGLGALRNVDA